ncbi:DegT/DnrJ/EryC1/StrS family aminotransferase [Amycolatopsis tolypomycina]|uniref:dTDP-4-amino-4,6-dideoxygalactose transaminase n=1 Tax=Amycolatopsis tolypomycina TaxID=208445 RepID=A0A1H4YXL5_9PSEU|nr:DegT/DnrJ/EryC1/StrS family aminotransferase [Amycolatopsis tolypomycina]SED21780.1 dTDP-4-amino-4,6-dideoxygalactose transaminase [Amycolatopsis tolypomycina]
MKVPFVDLAVHDPALRAEIMAAIEGVLKRGDYILGTEVDEFEREFAGYCGANHAVGVSSGTAALVLALRAAGAGPGTEVITVANSFLATVSSILLAGARPVLVDVGEDENIDVDAVRRAITGRTRAVLAVDLRGYPARLDELAALAGEHGLVLIEDASQAHGAYLHGRHVGTQGDFGCFSLHPLKNLPAPGDAGIVLARDEEAARRLRALRNHGMAERGFATVLGDNARLDSVLAAVLRVRLRTLDAANARRRSIARAYIDAFRDLPITLPPDAVGHVSAFHHFVVRVDDRPELLRSMTDSGVDARVHYPVPAHRQPAFRDHVVVPEQLHRTEDQAGRIVSLPCTTSLSDAQAGITIDAVRRHYRRRHADRATAAATGRE